MMAHDAPCLQCDGHGITGPRHENGARTICSACEGTGWRRDADTRARRTSVAFAPQMFTTVGAVIDMCGTDAGDPALAGEWRAEHARRRT